jgi:hypothetical protein
MNSENVGTTTGAPAPKEWALRRFSAHQLGRGLLITAGLAAILAANYFLRRYLEQSDIRIYSFIETFYPEPEKEMFGPGYPKWRWLIPIPAFGGSWTTTTLILTHLIEMRLTPPVTWYLFNAVLIIVSFVSSWAVFRSLIFAYTFTICMGFGTQLYQTYAVTGTLSFCLLFVYFELVLWSAVRVAQHPESWRWKGAFLASSLVMVVAYEGWLDFLVFAWVASAFVLLLCWHHRRREYVRGVAFCVTTLTVLGVAYLYIKLRFAFGSVAGTESDVVFNYPYLAPAIEDVFSNVVTHLYIVLTNFLPPSLVSSTAFWQLGGDKLVELQRGYHEGFLYLVPMHYLFLWRYAAGAAFVVFFYALVRSVRKAFVVWRIEHLVLVVLLIMTATGGPTHDFIKARPMKTMPLLGYHVMIGVLGMSLLISYGSAKAAQLLRSRVAAAFVVSGIWGLILYSALARPSMLAHQAAQIGLGEGIFPQPMAKLAQMFGATVPTAEGTTGYRLTRWSPALQALISGPAPAAVSRQFGAGLDPLPLSASNLTEWTLATGVTVTRSDGGYRVVGNSAAGGYQLSSPPIAVPRNHQMLIRVAGTTHQGRACFGVLNESQRWALAPLTDRSEFSLNTLDNQALMFVFVDCGREFGAGGPPTFEVSSVSYALLLSDSQPANRRR